MRADVIRSAGLSDIAEYAHASVHYCQIGCIATAD